MQEHIRKSSSANDFNIQSSLQNLFVSVSTKYIKILTDSCTSKFKCSPLAFFSPIFLSCSTCKATTTLPPYLADFTMVLHLLFKRQAHVGSDHKRLRRGIRTIIWSFFLTQLGDDWIITNLRVCMARSFCSMNKRKKGCSTGKISGESRSRKCIDGSMPLLVVPLAGLWPWIWCYYTKDWEHV